MNPNNCAMCDHKLHPDGGWCYMFRNEPEEICMQHTARMTKAILIDDLSMMRVAGAAWRLMPEPGGGRGGREGEKP